MTVTLSVADVRDTHADFGGYQTTLAGLLERLGAGTAEVLCAPGGLAVPVRAPVIWDSESPSELEPGDLILAVGVSLDSPAFGALLSPAAAAGAAGIAVKGLCDAAEVEDIARRTGVAVLSVPRGLPWAELHMQVRSVLDTDPALAGEAPGDVCRDLFDLADAAARILGGTVEIADSAMRLLAFANSDGAVDELHRAWIFERRAPAEFLSWLRRAGVFGRLRESVRPILVSRPGSRRRLAIEIRAGIEILGYLWLIEGAQGLPPSIGERLAEIARTTGAALVQRRAETDPARHLRARCLQGVLEGRVPARTAADELGIGPGKCRLVAFGAAGRRVPDRVAVKYAHDLITLRVESGCPGATVLPFLDRCYVFVADAESGLDRIQPLAEELVSLVDKQLGLAMVAAIGGVVTECDELPAARREVDRALRLLGTRRGQPVALAEELRSHAVLDELSELARDRPHLLRGRIDVLLELEAAGKTEYLPTLRAYFDAACDLTQAAKALFVHRNTLRYRLRRISELCGLDLADPVDRLVAELQLRLRCAE
ncbi:MULTISPECIES: PucR family transcriptional regulator [Amycolatopsis]|uniref:Transcriptional regulator n=1 Tax=Amycolatopsis methanolica 239 TaxID=1068978 RepID=A0A076MK24_AMYME|nr:PucR family transcriptional regulator [Amycolatopsis methanolica]AIJ21203.1 transcriptional regulator [Amycolatopsis methanolica 239]